ncbi:hypothetical protein BC628DRAFT_1050519 [Trametes gibbosa]|nr:hypothetical protein BC628DRAFT_1050519 [Trametes gibbosa]
MSWIGCFSVIFHVFLDFCGSGLVHLNRAKFCEDVKLFCAGVVRSVSSPQYKTAIVTGSPRWFARPLPPSNFALHSPYLKSRSRNSRPSRLLSSSPTEIIMTSERTEWSMTPGTSACDGDIHHVLDRRGDAQGAYLAASSLHPKPQGSGRGTPYKKNMKSHLIRLPKEKRRPSSSATFQPVAAPMPVAEGRNGWRDTKLLAQSLDDHDKENLYETSHYSAVKSADANLPHAGDYHEAGSPRSLPIDASTSLTSTRPRKSREAPSSSSHLPLHAPYIHLSRCGKDAPVYLDTLGDTPDEILALLKGSSDHPSECGQWMVVAAHYRSRGNVVAALAVVTVMVEGALSTYHNALPSLT